MPTIVVNGVAYDIALEPPRSLLHVLRDTALIGTPR
jgi:hypothetical protein